MSNIVTNTTKPVLAVVTRRFTASAERVFDAWLDPSKINGFIFGPHLRDEEVIEIEVDARVGGSFLFSVRRQEQQIDHMGEYLEIDRPHRLVFTWGVAQDESSSRVVIDIAPLAEGCELTLTHEMAPEWSEFVERSREAWGKMADALSVLLSREIPAPVAKTEMLIRRPVAAVFEAFIDPAITSKIWFTKGSDRLVAGKTVEWTWEMYGFSVQVNVLDIEENKRILVEWPGYGAPTTIEWLFTQRTDDTTFVTIKNAGFQGAPAQVMQQAIDATEGFTFVLAAAKALLEQDIQLNLVADRHPDGVSEQ